MTHSWIEYVVYALRGRQFKPSSFEQTTSPVALAADKLDEQNAKLNALVDELQQDINTKDVRQ